MRSTKVGSGKFPMRRALGQYIPAYYGHTSDSHTLEVGALSAVFDQTFYNLKGPNSSHISTKLLEFVIATARNAFRRQEVHRSTDLATKEVD